MVELKDIKGLITSPTAADNELLESAYNFAEMAHGGQKRLSGENYFSHAAETAKILAEYGMGATTVTAGILHDTIEDGRATVEEIKEKFGEEILFLVEGVTKLGKIKYHGADRYNESLRKLFVAVSQDIRVLMIKFADRLHNMRTLEHVPEEKRERIARETLEIYAPVAYRLGIRKLSRELEDLAFPYVYPKEYGEVLSLAKHKQKILREGLEKFLKSLKKELGKAGITKVRSEYRVKGLYSLYKKLLARDKNIEKIYDTLAVRIIVPTIPDCYRVLGVIHGTWRPLPRRIKDYIAFPKPNGYQSLHTTVFVGDGNIVEVQIRTEEIHRNSEYGIASHISYKETGGKNRATAVFNWIWSLLPNREGENEGVSPSSSGDVPQWIKELVEHHETSNSKSSLNEDLRSDFFHNRIFVFTPNGDVIDLPKDSSPVDFAYSIHSEVGNKMVGAKVNGKLVSLNSKLQNGDIVEISTKKNAKPSTKWLDYAKTTIAKKHIRSVIQRQKDSV
jgi:GTP pyrophosphokinase